MRSLKTLFPSIVNKAARKLPAQVEVEIQYHDVALYPKDMQYSPENAGIDLRAREEVFLNDNTTCMVGSAISVAIPEGHVGLLFPRSGLGAKVGVVLGNLTGVIDPGYRGEVKMCLWNRTNRSYHVARGDRVAQLVIVPTSMPVLKTVKQFTADSERGENGFGSSGK